MQASGGCHLQSTDGREYDFSSRYMTSQQIPRAWIRLPSGRHLDLINPCPDAWLDTDLATRLTRTYRWGGESKWALPLSVAQHSLTVLALRRQRAPTMLSREQALLELLHDAEEAFLGFDCIAPLKAVLGRPFHTVSNRIGNAILSRYRLGTWQEADYVLHKEADVMAAASEAVHCVGWSRDEVRDVLGIEQPVLDTDPLVAVYGDVPWKPWPPELAAKRFVDELAGLVSMPDSTLSAIPA